MLLVPSAQSFQHFNRRVHVRLVHKDRRKAPFERGIFFDVIAILGERRRADALQFAARERRLHHVRRVNRALRRARADDRVQFVNEQDDFAFGIVDFVEGGFEAFLKLAAKARPGDHRAEIERDDAFAHQRFGHVAGDDFLREPLDDGGFANTRFADQDGVVFGAAR